MRIRIEKIVYPGRRLGLQGGKVVFTDRGLAGETVEVEVTKERRSYAEARTTAILEPSPDRVEPRCAHYLACSPYQDMDYRVEVETKRTQVEEILTRALKRPFGKLPITPSPEVWGYRNKIALRVAREDGRAELVYHERGQQASYVAVDTCFLVPDRVNDILARVREAVATAPLTTVEGLEVRTSRSSGESIVLCELGAESEIKAVATALKDLAGECRLVGAVASVYDGKHVRGERLFGRDFVEERAGGLTFRIGAWSFFQINTAILERVLKDVAEAAGQTADMIVADLYCGLGTFGLFLAKRSREVFGVEPDPENVEFLKKNLELNGVGNFAVCEGTAEEWLPEVLERSPAVIVIDPPRRGIDPSIVRGLVEAPVPRLLYLSCNPTTLARDLGGLAAAYEIADVRVYDFFPHTPHIETLAVLAKKAA
ncbi:MAG TPA: 23S rRNA (uracil(1939)-C(5))-methyltransferase RlmD [Candidatus Aminicenantes bacterium]|nr:23S rRNA (uracil(1939)-C(5))-methyltransferase RlmD [Candidatus Aminicenantes bacterium]